jgi:hypothetical protein
MSLLVRVTRNCPWNRCAFCPVYKGEVFSLRTVEDVQRDVVHMGKLADALRSLSTQLGHGGEITWEVRRAATAMPNLVAGTAQIANFLADGARHVFLQDANSLVMRPEQLLEVLQTIRQTFPSVARITCYARAHTLVRRKPEQLRALCEAGLNRVHVGLESGSDRVLALVGKGVTAEQHIEAGLRAKRAGMELSEYLMPGLGGRGLWREHALESARVLGAINPHFIRLRTTAVSPGSELDQLALAGEWEPMDDEQIVEELQVFLENLDVSSELRSDHVLNLFAELEGRLPEDKPKLLSLLARFRAMDAVLRRAFIVARRGGMVSSLDEMELEPARESALHLLSRVEAYYAGDLRAAMRELTSRLV